MLRGREPSRFLASSPKANRYLNTTKLRFAKLRRAGVNLFPFCLSTRAPSTPILKFIKHTPRCRTIGFAELSASWRIGSCRVAIFHPNLSAILITPILRFTLAAARLPSCGNILTSQPRHFLLPSLGLTYNPAGLSCYYTLLYLFFYTTTRKDSCSSG